MQALKNTFSGLAQQLQKLDSLIEPYLSGVTIYRPVTIQVNFDHAPQCFDHIVSWSYSLIFESINKHYDFLLKQAQKLAIPLSQDAVELKQCVHYLRTFAQHSQFDPGRLSEFSDYKNAWFQKLCSQNEPSLEEHWIICAQNILNALVEVICCFERTIIDAINSEFKHVFIQSWSKSALRTFSKYEYERVLIKVLEDHGLASKLDPQLFTKKYLNDWQRGMEILPDGFNFENEVYPIIQRSIAKEEVIPINGPELRSAGIPAGPMLGKCIAEARKSFYADPCSSEELIQRIIIWHKAQ